MHVTATTAPTTAPGLVDRLWRVNDYVMHRLPGGAGLIQPRQVINLAKFGVGPLTLGLMLGYQNFTLAAWLYLALHGLYGILWVAKDVAFGDPGWTGRASLTSGLAVFVFPLGGYFMAPLILLTPLGHAIPGGWGTAATLPLPVAFAAVFCFSLGVFFTFVSDAQKFFVLKHQRPRQLITDGMFALTRNPNYFGEVLIYGSFNLLAQHWLPWAICGFVWVQVFLVNMVRKERSMSRYPEHAEWVKRTGFFFPSIAGLVKGIRKAF